MKSKLGITAEEYELRRQRLAQKLPENAIAIIPGAHEKKRNGDTEYAFRQDSDFYYLTGFTEPEAILILVGGSCSEWYLFNRPRDPAQEQWTGKRLGQEAAIERFKLTAAFPYAEFASQLPKLLENRTAVYCAIGRHFAIEKHVLNTLNELKKLIRRGISAPSAIEDLEPLLSEMRLIKSPAEMALMRKAAEVSIAAHEKLMQMCKHAQFEWELEAEFFYALQRQGCRHVAYEPIIGCAENTCILHYNQNNQPLIPGQMLLVDAGAEFENYASDITRTYPVNGQFSPEQKHIYQLVLSAQRAGIACIKPGTPWNKIQEVMVSVITHGLWELGLLKGEPQELIEKQAYKPFYMHSSGHWLGLDVHDVGFYKINNTWRSLQPGMVLTVEPGIYIASHLPDVDKRWWNIGVRIEDDIVVTEDGYENLTQALPVEIKDIEACMRG